MNKSLSLLVSRIDSRISAIEKVINPSALSTSELAFLSGRISAFRSVFAFSFRFIEIRDDHRILFHHIKDRPSFERFAIACFLEICANHKWLLSFKRKVSKLCSHFTQVIKKPSKPSSSRVFMFH